ncbi:MAG: MBL fold metallo-hydrolase [Candidatus Aminicenantes bacterium]|nr:MBL fold metallo-hydrolase [Candidatus Aminicenantes bacterium]NIM78603.1 MBL fold metallo-hydrolase [Candidatus Aminicenantes bacterium]NIN17848.1 MBL fold metallo-hydrolase [Candidatus Aminicenantes bacterium]NIN41752.1 MBL fold metallo-hydrolase [Candidatus Aminicenantes bacterium]NIN84501.1 MBL fold metallo-hydrolase [Candidatus Aminicenantes bacterium]
MKTKNMIGTAVLFFTFLFLFHTTVFAQEAKPKVTEVANNLYMITKLDYSGNVGFLVTEEGVLVVDSGGLPSMGKVIVEKVKEKTGKPIKYLVLTHYHGDHTYGIDGFPEGVTIIGQRNIVKNIKELNAGRSKDYIEKSFPGQIKKWQEKIKELKDKNDPEADKEEEALKRRLQYIKEYKTIKFNVPDVLFDQKKTLKLGGETIELIYPGNAHTRCNCMVYFSRLKSIHMGDLLFHNSFPYVDPKAGSNTRNWIDTLKKAAGMNIETVIPGHGELASKKGLLPLARYLEDLRKQVKAAIKKGLTLEKIKETITFPAYKDFKLPELRVNNIDAVYHELTGK